MPSEDPEDQTAAPAIIMVACGMNPAALVLPPNADLGRRISAAGSIHEVAEERMSRDHATVRWDRGTWVITDLESRNGTFVNGERIAGEARHRGDAVVRLGHTVFLLVADGRGHPVPDGDPVVGPELARVHAQIRRNAGGDTLLVEGEPGSGKELAARLFHDAGPRRSGPFVTVNCAAIPDGVADRLLFGGKKGAFETIGHFQMAHGGTLFLDEIADLDAAAQNALWRVLDVRDSNDTPIELGVVAGGHELHAAVSEGHLHGDLHQRLLQTMVQLPPLRMRRVDIARLVQHEIAEVAAKTGLILATHPKLVEACCLRPWPGNVRELRASVRHAAMSAAGSGRDVVRLEDLPETAGMPPGTASETAVERPNAGELDKSAIVTAMERANGVVSVAARALGLHRSQLYRLLDDHDIAHD